MLYCCPVLLLLLLATVVDSGCVFPASLQTNRTSGPARDWVGRVREQFTEIGVHVVVSSNVIRVTSSDSTSWRSYTVVCLQVVSSDRYLVAYEERVQRRARYSCLQFVRRAPDVIQMRAAVVGGRMDRAMCQDSSLVTDQWLIFDRSRLGQRRVPCPLNGGYSVHLFDKVDTTSQSSLKPTSQLRFDYDTTTTSNRHVHFLLASNWKQARAIRRSRIV